MRTVRETARAIVRLDQDGKLVRRYSSIPIAACLLERKESEVKEWVRNPQLIREQSRWMYEKDYLRAKDENGVVKELTFDIYRKEPVRHPRPKAEKEKTEGCKRRRNHTGTIYTELHNRGRRHPSSDSGNSVSVKVVKGVGMVTCYKYRWVAEITYQRKRYRCRSSHFNVVRDWLDEMIARFS